jgi:putative FmdB family regulatory protein
MPTYRYRCDRCGDQLETWQSIHDPALTVHDGACGGHLSKVLGVGGIVLKGPGFYRTDSRAAASKDRDDKAASSNGSADKSEPRESKPGGDEAAGSSKPGSSKPDASGSGSSKSGSSVPSGAKSKRAGT